MTFNSRNSYMNPLVAAVGKEIELRHILPSSFGSSCQHHQFKFFDKDEGRFRFWDSQNEQITDVDLVGNLDPFNAECRAYGRIEEIYTKYRAKNIDIGIIAIPCYGYIEISSSHERDIVARFGPLDFQRSETNTITPLRAIVKQYSSHIPIDPKKRSIKLMLRDLKTMHNNGLYPIDIRAENYREGRLVDFGMALTEPSCVLRVLDGYMADRERGRGLGSRYIWNWAARMGISNKSGAKGEWRR
ncbi:uncharacterized protein CC84DRAFT_1174232 [Paraphaeosphaeria sporulosa]|uniref:Protein kinase domain-containing protein n=1 Tax=Paraphaeosphaeria sporulosa TaxID=1460663 RepID=A0A177CPB7_9PLEO|nr:uncharacterized protein CC84DRAFT_1174232 [Paraphaeosphaeria sporulosa]OAG08812.1 hypothetical protein CC84DRAFT_1174232 [Paraphaeosphaeria sporulosa]